MRKRISLGVAVVVVALALPLMALAATSKAHTFTLRNGLTHKVLLVHMRKTGTLKLLFHYSDVKNPHAHFYVSLKKAGWKEDVLLIDTADRSSCQGALGTFFCPVTRGQTTKGWYNVKVIKATVPAAKVGITITHP